MDASVMLVFGLLNIMLSSLSLVTGQTSSPSATSALFPTQTTSVVPPSTESMTTDFQTTEARTTESSQLDENTDLGPCICDLTAFGCDVNCCCDGDCTEADKDTFSECTDQKYMVDDKVCVQDTVVVRSNTPDSIEVTDSSLFCVRKDNYAERNYYTIPDSVTSVEDFDQLSSQYGSFSYEVPSSTSNTYGEYYKSGDVIYTIYETLSLGLLGLPQPLTSGECVDTNPAAFLHETSSSCVREVRDLAEMCESLPQLSGRTFTDGFKLVSTPKFLQENPPPEPSVGDTTTAAPVTPSNSSDDNNSTEATMTDITTTIDVLYYDSPGLVPLDVLQPICRSVIDVDCDFDDVPLPSYNETSATCSNVLLEMSYLITHNATDGIEEASVQLVLGDVRADQVPVVQTFKISFEKSGQSEEPFQRSGNPGYIVGEPLMAGTRISLEGGTKLAIAFRDDRDSWLTVVRSTTDGSCLADADSRIPVTFGEDVRTGCIISISLASTVDACGLIQAQILNALKGPLPEEYYVAMFGDSSVEVVGDWVPVLQEDIAGAPSSPAVGTCSNMVTGLHIEVIYANVGSLQNPQPKILGVKYNYADGKILKYQCLGSSCQDDASSIAQRFEITSSVTFIDGSTQPAAVVAERPSWQSKLPNDFLYPFTGSSMSSAAVNSVSMATFITILIVAFVT